MRYLNRWLVISVLTLVAPALLMPLGALAAKDPPPPARKPTIVQSKRASAETVFRSMLISHEYESKFERSFVKPGTDLVQYHVEELAALSALASGVSTAETPVHPLLPKVLPKGARIKKVFAYYGMGAAKLARAIVAAKNAGVEIEIMTDLNRSLKGNFGDGARSLDFANAAPMATEDGRAISRFLKSGFKIGGEGSYRILSQPLFNTEIIERIPIFHLKESYTVLVHADGREEVLYMTSGTANMNQELPRYNRFAVIDDPDLMAYGYTHYKKIESTFAAGGSIADVPETAPIEVQYGDGTSALLEYTDGKFNTNDRLVEFYEEAAAKSHEIKINEIMSSNFVLTYNNFIQKLGEVLNANPHAKFWGVGDQKFLSDSQWGLWRVLEGITAYRPMGAPLPGFKFDQRMHEVEGTDGKTKWESRVDFHGWMRVVEGRVLRDLDGAPLSIEVWHDKTTLTKFERDGEKWNLVSTGSFNMSGNFQNMESQLYLKLKGDSKIAEAITESVTAVVKNNPRHAIPSKDVFFLEELGRFLGIGYNHVEAPRAKELLRLIQGGELEMAHGYMLSIGRGQTDLDEKLMTESLQSRVKRIFDFLAWLKKYCDASDAEAKSLGIDVKPGKLYRARTDARMLIPLLKALWDPMMSTGSIQFIIGGLVWKLGAGSHKADKAALTAQNEGLKREAWNVLKIPRAYDRPAVVEGAPKRPGFRPRKGFEPIVARFFDIDDTLFFLGTKIILYKNADRTIEHPVSSEEFAAIRASLSEKGSEWVIDGNGPNGGSFRNFRDKPGQTKSHFEEDLEAAMASGKPWMAPGLTEYNQSVSTEEGAKHTFLETARGQEPESLHRGLTFYADWAKKNLGLTLFVPPVENIHPVSNPKFEKNPETGEQFTTEGAKAYYIFRELVKLNAFSAANPERGKVQATFIDDDHNNVLGAIRRFVNERQTAGSDLLPNVQLFVEHVLKNGSLTRYSVLTNGDVLYREYEEDEGESTTGLKRKKRESCADYLTIQTEPEQNAS